MPSVLYDWQIFCEQEVGGVSRYFAELAAHVDELPQWRARVVAPLHINEHLKASRTRTIGKYVPHRMRPRLGILKRSNRLIAPAVKRVLSPAIVHRTYYSNEARDSRSRVVLTVYDMIHELFAAEFASHDSTSQRKRLSVEQADHVICISRCTANDLVRLFDVPREKVSVIHLGFPSDFGAATAREGQGRPNLLYVGHRDGYKNFDGTLRAYADSPQLRRDFDLLAFGGPPFSTREVAAIDALGLESRSVRRIAGSDRELAAAYRNARAFVYPSRYEGFGIPPLEAMASRCPVACSNAASIPEVVGDAAELFDPDGRETMRAAMERVCYDESRRAELVAAGLRRLQTFSWQRCATETAGVYAKLLD